MDTISDHSDQDWPPVQLAWRQKLAAFWSLAWPSLVVSMYVLFALTGALTSDKVETPETLGLRAPIAALASNSTFLIVQMLLVPRLWRKRYRSFRVKVLREDSASKAAMSASEIMQVGLRLVLPQAAFIVLSALAVLWAEAASDDPRTARGVATLLLWLRFLLVGPYALHFAIPRSYSGFRLQTYAQRFI